MKFAPTILSRPIVRVAALILILAFAGWLLLARSAPTPVETASSAGPTPGPTLVIPTVTGSRGNTLGRGVAGSNEPGEPATGSRVSPLATPDVRAGPPGASPGANPGAARGPVGAVTAQIIRPLLGARVRAGEPITITYSAAAAAGLTGVQLWSDGSLYAGYSDPSATMKSLKRSQHWSSAVPGRHALTVVARDAQGHTSGTVPVIVLVTGEPAPLMPAVSLLAPPAGARVPLGQNIPVTITASSPNGITRVEFWRDWGLAGVWQSPDSNGLQVAGFSLAWTAPLTGTYTLWASAYDLAGLKTATQPITIAVVLPVNAAVQPPPLPSPGMTVPPAEPTQPIPMATFVPGPEQSPGTVPTDGSQLAPGTEATPWDPNGPPPASSQDQAAPAGTSGDNPGATSTPESP